MDAEQVNDLPREEVLRDEVAQLAGKLVEWFEQFSGVVVAFSGGVDSAVVAAAAFRALGQRALAVTSRSASVSAVQLDWAARTAAEIGVRHRVVGTDEVARDEYRENTSKRCFFCKQTLYGTLKHVAQEEGLAAIVSGTNFDDLGDYRPGIEAGRIEGVETPLADLGISKPAVRQLARLWKLSVWDQPASPCLASRVAYGVEVTEQRLEMIERGEAWLRERGFDELRVRLHSGELARIEVPLERLPELAGRELAQALVSTFRELGFRNVTLDLAGLRSGSLNELIQIGVAGNR